VLHRVETIPGEGAGELIGQSTYADGLEAAAREVERRGRDEGVESGARYLAKCIRALIR
jgi:hypothetical protein